MSPSCISQQVSECACVCVYVCIYVHMFEVQYPLIIKPGAVGRNQPSKTNYHRVCSGKNRVRISNPTNDVALSARVRINVIQWLRNFKTVIFFSPLFFS